MATIKKCKWCGRLYESFGPDMCAKCVHDLDEDFVKVRTYLYTYPNASVAEVVQETQVDERVVLYLVKEGRLVLVEGVSSVRCEKCGRSVETGKLCRTCSEALSQLLSKAGYDAGKSAKNEKKEDGRTRGSMHTF